MEKFQDKSDCLKLEIEELDLLMGPEDSEVNLRYILTHASRRGSRIFEIFSTKEKSGRLAASKVRWDEYQRDRGWRRRRKRGHKEACKVRTTKEIFAEPRRVKGLRGEC